MTEYVLVLNKLYFTISFLSPFITCLNLNQLHYYTFVNRFGKNVGNLRINITMNLNLYSE